MDKTTITQVAELYNAFSKQLHALSGESWFIAVRPKKLYAGRMDITPQDYFKVQEIKEIVCKYHGITIEQVDSEYRQKEIVDCRFMCIGLCDEFTAVPPGYMGRLFGQRKYSSIVYAIETNSDRVHSLQDYRKVYLECKQLVESAV
jgi:chromosomal replication initiation ATPase DnaA